MRCGVYTASSASQGIQGYELGLSYRSWVWLQRIRIAEVDEGLGNGSARPSCSYSYFWESSELEWKLEIGPTSSFLKPKVAELKLEQRTLEHIIILTLDSNGDAKREKYDKW